MRCPKDQTKLECMGTWPDKKFVTFISWKCLMCGWRYRDYKVAQ